MSAAKMILVADLLAALVELHRVCVESELERQDLRPTEARYQAAIRGAADVIASATPAPAVDPLAGWRSINTSIESEGGHVD